MVRMFSLFTSILIFLIIVIIAFENLFMGKASYYILFWQFSGPVTWLIIAVFLLGLLFGLSLFNFFYTTPGNMEVEDTTDSGDWE